MTINVVVSCHKRFDMMSNLGLLLLKWPGYLLGVWEIIWYGYWSVQFMPHFSELLLQFKKLLLVFLLELLLLLALLSELLSKYVRKCKNSCLISISRLLNLIKRLLIDFRHCISLRYTHRSSSNRFISLKWLRLLRFFLFLLLNLKVCWSIGRLFRIKLLRSTI